MADRYLVLANSRKQMGRCVAVVDESGTWLRPVSGVGTGELQAADCVHAGSGASLLPLDVVATEFGDPFPTHYQPEDHIQPKTWDEPEWISSDELSDWLERTIDHHADFLTKGRVDRISEISAKEDPLRSSLALVRPDALRLLKTTSFKGGPQVRAQFSCQDLRNNSGEPIWFDLVVTDDAFETRFHEAEYGATLEFGHDETVYLTLSLSVPYKGDHYKLVAGVVTQQEVKESHGRAGILPF